MHKYVKKPNTEVDGINLKNGKAVYKSVFKKSVIVLLVISIILVLFIQLFPSVAFDLPLSIKKHDAMHFINGEYATYSGGDTASKLFPTIAELGDYESLEFIYVNNILRFSIFYGRYGNSFMLDVDYDYEQFDRTVVRLLSRYNCGDLKKNDKLYTTWYGAFYIVEFPPGSLDNEQYFYLCINDKEKIVRFLFLEDSFIENDRRLQSDFGLNIWGDELYYEDSEYVESVEKKYSTYLAN